MTRLLLFTSSLSPGIVVISVRYLADSPLPGLIGIFAGILLMSLGFVAIWSRGKTEPVPKEIRSIKDETYQVPTYLVTFLLPFLFIEARDIPSLFAYAIFAGFVALILFRNDISLVNPGLLLAHYRLYDAVDASGENITVIAKSRPRLTGHESLRTLSGNVYLLEPQESESK